MITYEEALELILTKAGRVESEQVPLLDSTGRVLAEDVFSDINMPPFNRSAVDGFACRRGDLHLELEVIETVRAGTFPSKRVHQGECIRIMTGAPVPEGADCVVMVEETREIGENRISFIAEKTKTNISPFAEDIKVGEKVLASGTMIGPQHIAIMASVGYTNPLVAGRPEVAIITTGDEIVEPDLKPGPSQIRNSNSYQLMAQAGMAGTLPLYLGIIPDDEDKTFHAINESMEKSDVLLLTGGISMGDYDFVPKILEKAGVDILFRTIAIQPGKPTLFGTKGKKRIFGLPGNPVSSFTVFEILVKPMLWKMMGVTEPVRKLMLPLGEDFRRKRSDRLQWMPVEIRGGKLYPLEYHGSAHIFSLYTANAIAAIPLGVTQLNTGDLLDVRQI